MHHCYSFDCGVHQQDCYCLFFCRACVTCCIAMLSCSTRRTTARWLRPFLLAFAHTNFHMCLPSSATTLQKYTASSGRLASSGLIAMSRSTELGSCHARAFHAREYSLSASSHLPRLQDCEFEAQLPLPAAKAPAASSPDITTARVAEKNSKPMPPG